MGTRGSRQSTFAMSSNYRTAEWLTEEWTIRPDDTLPSLWEIAGVNAVEVAVTEAIQAAVHVVLLRWRNILDGLRRRLASSETYNAERNVSFPAFNASHQMESPLVQRKWSFAHVARWIVAMLDRISSSHGATLYAIVIRYVLERSCLRLSSPCVSSLAESLYGLGRVTRKGGDKVMVPLADRDQKRLALLLALGPSFNQLIKTARDSRWPRTMQYRTLSEYLGIIVPTMAWAATVAQLGGTVYCHWRYLLGDFAFTDMRSLLLNQILIRRHRFASPAAESPISETQTTPPDSTSASTGQQSADLSANPYNRVTQQSSKILLSAVGVAVALSWMTQVLGWYQDRYRERRRQQAEPQGEERLPGSVESAIPPPLLFNTSDTRAALQLPKGSCPLCSRRRLRDPTACASSGFVFCHQCILAHVRRHATCPVTGSAVSESQLVRIYEPRNNA
jgi:hypothetical protein